MNKKTFLIGSAHIDPVWQWCVPEGLALIKSTFNAALQRMYEYPDYVFTSACAGYYKWIKLSEPEMFEEIKQRVAQGRWCITGAMWVQPDCNIPSGEAFARHLLYSQRFFIENFGISAKTGYNVDSFGHNGMLAQLFAKSGIKNYVYMRPNDITEKPSLPKKNLHILRSPDSSEVLAFRIPDGMGGYTGEIDDERLAYFKSLPQPQMLFYGVGNHGGGPAKRHLDAATQLIANDNENYAFSSPDKYFDFVRENVSADDLPVVTDDLQHHASGCYSACANVKLMNRRAEDELVYAEKIAVMSSLLTGGSMCSEQLGAAWERVMFSQFHDILAGCSIKPAYDDAFNAFGAARTAALEIGSYAAQRISWRVNTTKFFENKPSMMRDRLWLHDGEGSPMVVFNPHSFAVKTNICFGMGWVSGVTDSEDNDIPFQIVRAPYTDGGHYKQCMFEADIPAYGWATYFIFKDEQNYTPKPVENEFKVSCDSLENDLVKLTFDKSGCITGYYDKQTSTQYASDRMARAVVGDDILNDTWAHNEYDLNRDIGEFTEAVIEVSEYGPLRASVKIVSFYGKSVLTQYISLTRGSKVVSVRVKLDFREQYKTVKLSFPVNIQNPKALYSMPFGFIEKSADGLEEPSQKWVAAVDNNNKGLALINDCKYSFCLKDNDLRFIAARGCAYLDHFGQASRDNDMPLQDQGEQEFEYELMPFDGDAAPVVKRSLVLNMPCRLYNETHHKGELASVGGNMSVSAENIIVEAVKESEDKNGIILRAYECAGRQTDAVIDFLPVGKSFSGKWKPQEIKTLLFSNDGEVKEVMLTEYDM